MREKERRKITQLEGWVRLLEDDIGSVVYRGAAERAGGEGGGTGDARAEVGAGHEDGSHGAVQAHATHQYLLRLLQSLFQFPFLGLQFLQFRLKRLLLTPSSTSSTRLRYYRCRIVFHSADTCVCCMQREEDVEEGDEVLDRKSVV